MDGFIIITQLRLKLEIFIENISFFSGVVNLLSIMVQGGMGAVFFPLPMRDLNVLHQSLPERLPDFKLLTSLFLRSF